MTPQLSQAIGHAQALAYELRFINDAVTGAINEIDTQYTLSAYTPVIRHYLAQLAAALDAAEMEAEAS